MDVVESKARSIQRTPAYYKAVEIAPAVLNARGHCANSVA
jgi:hypothetical protein